MNVKKGTPRLDDLSYAMGKEIARLRRERLWSGKHLGRLVGVSQQQISRYERGVCEMSLTTLCVLLHHFGVSLESFFYTLAVQLRSQKSVMYAKYGFLFQQKSLLTSYPNCEVMIDIYSPVE